MHTLSHKNELYTQQVLKRIYLYPFQQRIAVDYHPNEKTATQTENKNTIKNKEKMKKKQSICIYQTYSMSFWRWNFAKNNKSKIRSNIQLS